MSEKVFKIVNGELVPIEGGRVEGKVYSAIGTDTGEEWFREWTDEEVAQRAAEEAAHAAAKQAEIPARMVNYLALRARLTDAERAAILGSTDWRVRDFLGMAQAERDVNLAGALAQQAKALLVALDLLTQARADEVFA